MQYEVKYLFKGVRGTYYVTFDRDVLLRQDIDYSIRQSIMNHLGSNQFEIISYSRVI